MTFVTVALLNSAFFRDHDDHSSDGRSHGSADTVITGAVLAFPCRARQRCEADAITEVEAERVL